MRQSEKAKTNNAYNKWAKSDPTEAEQVGWTSQEDQTSRFEQFLELQKLKKFEKSRILDVGCGYGYFLDFLKNKKIKVKDYFGIDINPNFVKKAQQKYPKQTFVCGDLVTFTFTESFDFAIASGIFNVKCAGGQRAYDLLFETINKMLDVTEKAIAFNFLSKKEHEGYALTKTMQVYDAKKIIDWCKKQNVKEIKKIDGYDPFDTTIILVK